MQIALEEYIIGILSALAATILFAVTNVIYRKIDSEISILNIAISRIWVSLPLAYVFAVAVVDTPNVIVPLEAMFPLAISMIIGIIVGDTMYFLSQERIGVARAFPITMSYPLVVYLLAAIFLEEPVIMQRIVGAIGVVIGVILIARSKESEESENFQRWSRKDRRIGVLLAFLTIITWAASDVIFQFGLISAGAAEANYFRMLVASIIFIPIFFVSLKRGNRMPAQRILVIALITGIFGMGFSLIAFSYAVKLVGATITSVLIASAPMITAPLAVVYLREDVNRFVIIGTMLTIVGIILVVAI